MAKSPSIALGAAILLAGTGIAAADHPIFQINGFPVTRHQVIAVSTGLVREGMPAPHTVAGTPASPHQVAVLTPRVRLTQQEVTVMLAKAGFSRVRIVTPTDYKAIGWRNGQWEELVINSRTGQLR